MYCIKRMTPIFNEQEYTEVLSYYTYDGWTAPVEKGQSLDLSGVVLFTEREARVNELPPNEEFQWYGAYKR